MESTTLGLVQLLRKLLTLPTLAYVPIHLESFINEKEAEVSTQLLISQAIGGKEFVTDNIAPGPRIWTIKGYLKGIPYIEIFNYFMPSLLAQKIILDFAYNSRKPIPFKTTDGEVLDVLIKKRTYIEEPDNMNSVKIELVLQELNYLSVASSIAGAVTEQAGKKSLFKTASANGAALSFGVVAVVAIADLLS